jgi:hypothetical protein
MVEDHRFLGRPLFSAAMADEKLDGAPEDRFKPVRLRTDDAP